MVIKLLLQAKGIATLLKEEPGDKIYALVMLNIYKVLLHL